MTKEEISELKSKHRLELVMQEGGEIFEVDAKNPDQWRSKKTHGLSVDIKQQRYELSRPGMDAEMGDVIAWLQRRYAWDFGKRITYLKNRAPDPKRETQPVKIEKVKPQIIIRKDEDEEKPLDQWQEKALKIGGERMRKYFSWKEKSIELISPETRIEPTHAPWITKCEKCKAPFNWDFRKTQIQIDDYSNGWHNISWRYEHIGAIPVIAYSIKRRLDVSGLGLIGSKELKEVFDEAKMSEDLQKKINWAIEDSFDGLITVVENLFVETEDYSVCDDCAWGVVCTKCAWEEMDFLSALEYCKISAYWREDARWKEEMRIASERNERERNEREREEEERLSDSLCGLDDEDYIRRKKEIEAQGYVVSPYGEVYRPYQRDSAAGRDRT